MNIRIIMGLFFLSAFQCIVFCQTEVRPLTPFQAFEVQRGKVEHFKTLTYRYEVAWEELDLQSMMDLKNGLLELMNSEIRQYEGKGELAPTETPTKQMKECAEKLRKIQLKANDTDLGDSAEKVKQTLHDFITILEKALSKQLVELRAENKQ